MRPLQNVEQLPLDSENSHLEEIMATNMTELEKVESEEKKKKKRLKPHIVRRNVEDYLEQRALEKRLRDVFDTDY